MLVTVLVAWCETAPAGAQRLPQPGAGLASAAAAPTALAALTGAWVRPDGGCIILIRGAAADVKASVRGHLCTKVIEAAPQLV